MVQTVRRRRWAAEAGKTTFVAALLALAACGESDGANAERAASAPAGASAAVGSQAATAATPGRKDWTKVVEATADHGFRVGNPDAPVKLLEFASLTCPHCADFNEQAHDAIVNNYVATGKVSYELRNFVMNGPDLAATMLARCEGPQTFFRLVEDFFGQQAEWVEAFQTLTPADEQRIQALPPGQQTAALADAGGLDDFMRARGMGKAKFNQCLSDESAVATLSGLRNQAVEKYNLTGTPTFVLNGETLADVTTWAQLEPRLQAALQ